MLTESFVAATLAANKAAAHATAALKDVGIFLHEFQPQSTLRHGFKKSSSQPDCVAISDSHVFAAQADKAVVNVYNRERGNQEATVPFPERIHSVAYAKFADILVLGTEGGKLILWELATGRVTNSSASHLQAVSRLCITPKNEYILSGSADSSIHLWSLARLVSFEQLSDSYGSEEPSNAPAQTFSGHRTAITALACGHSLISTNFAVSASDDGTCYVWHISTCQVLRTLLLPSLPVSITLDPADRAIYFGCNDGRIQAWDIFMHVSKLNVPLSSSSQLPPIQLLDKDSWSAPSSDLGSANCLTISYDGTALLSGHANGAIIRWDVAKHRILNEITNLGQPVTNISMLNPEGFPNQKKAKYVISQVIKPNLEFSSMRNNGTCGIPANYGLHVMIANSTTDPEHDDFEHALTRPGISQAMLDAAVHSLALGSAPQGLPSTDTTALAKTERLEEEVTKLKQQLAAIHSVEEKRKARKLARIAKRDELGMKKREAYFDAKKLGKDGDAAMKSWERKEAEVDQESDEEALGDGDQMDIS
ncbi:WD domain, G-beta repeat containing protein [Cladophialophora carrionii]|uniref:Pre-rRNA-processing protein IPI3 n=1 Tax=Cladophialophora carrionii TaxID=86049 RepID=A0A1C1CUS0_9EURO|nr:WD domain, G-beta repeat containing protein [Cladophialophora carrionii]